MVLDYGNGVFTRVLNWTARAVSRVAGPHGQGVFVRFHELIHVHLTKAVPWRAFKSASMGVWLSFSPLAARSIVSVLQTMTVILINFGCSKDLLSAPSGAPG